MRKPHKPWASGLLVAAGPVAVALAAALGAGRAAGSASDYEVVSVRILVDGGRVDWSPDGARIYYDHQEGDGYWDVYWIRADGTGSVCLTCNHPQLPNKNQGQPEAHPGGRYLVFQAEKAAHRKPFAGTEPGRGYYNDLWALDLQTNQASRLTNVSALRLSGSLHPQFSHDGRKLLWTDLEGPGGRYGNWRLAVADFVTTPTPHLENQRYYNPGPQPVWLESHGWGPDDSWIYFACTPLLGMDENNMDICRMDFSNPTQVTRLTFTSGLNGELGEWDEHAHLSPLNDALSWVSSNGYAMGPDSKYQQWLRTEVWLMETDGSEPRRMTAFNLGGDAYARDNDWNPAAAASTAQLAVSVYDRSAYREEIKIIEFALGAGEGALLAPSGGLGPAILESASEDATHYPPRGQIGCSLRHQRDEHEAGGDHGGQAQAPGAGVCPQPEVDDGRGDGRGGQRAQRVGRREPRRLQRRLRRHGDEECHQGQQQEPGDGRAPGHGVSQGQRLLPRRDF